MPRHEVVVVGAGIVGLATAHRLAGRGHRVTVVDKEPTLAAHQTGRNSGVVHSGLYYRPGSLKARLGTAGAASMVEFASRHGITVDRCGKLVVATDGAQLTALDELVSRGVANGVPCRRVDADEAHELEPYVSALAAVRVESTAVVDYVGVCVVLADLVGRAGGDVLLGREVLSVEDDGRGLRIGTSGGELRADRLVNCAGLHSDRVARLAGVDPQVRIVPFRGEYFELAPHARHLVNGLVYPVPDPDLPFLGVHLTRMFDGSVHAGPNAVLAGAREGYDWRTVRVRDLADAARWPGTWRLARRWWRTGVDEVLRSLSQRRFLESLRELVPSLQSGDLVPSEAGVRAQAVDRSGAMVDDFLLRRAPRQLHVLNAPSPAATAALEIGDHVARELEAVR
ncbi:L-2-hydroxyglutarate oxidase [Aeromicrobium sp. Leaf291]|uniref:L-2-hydroxyglutarate oxidase n=1 Tax=Aeromicrobium sp. Leaf291 TaxID=1736325 RepID=UPI0006F827AA|nr:L-2-hydroxyglutarate oxidase [Aeromicrobium sp. Leaf291]KQP84875.1 hydroxyglutarate oxidase [Aeromicrobium sp. Leaf291]